MRSASFRTGSISTATGPLSPGPFSPDSGTAPEIYRKHVVRIEELEKENERLAREAAEHEKRWKKTEEELADLREAEAEADGEKKPGDGQIEKLVRAETTKQIQHQSKTLTWLQKNDIAGLQRQNAQLQQQVTKSGPRHGSSPSISMSQPPSDLEERLASKSSTIETMELEISKLRAALDRHASGTASEREQIAALEEKVVRAETAAGKAQRELADLRRNLDRTAEKAVREGSERTSAETKLRSLEHDLADQMAARLDLETKVEAFEKKVATLTTLHKEQDSRMQALRRDKERAEKEVGELKARNEKLESENVKLKSRRSVEGGGGLDDDAVDELVNEERLRLEKRVRDLESENSDLRRGVWREKRGELEREAFQDVDLGGNPLSPSQKKPSGGFGDFLQSGLNALTGADEGFLDDDGGDMDFDEDAFRKAQEDEANKRIERIKEIKRALKNWEGWRLDLVESRRGGGVGIGEVFEI